MVLGHGIGMGVYPPSEPSGESNQSTAFLIPGMSPIYITFGTVTRHQPDYSRLRYY